MPDNCNSEMDVNFFAMAIPGCTNTVYKLQNISSCLDAQTPPLDCDPYVMFAVL
jgi:hypothetical protein